MKTEERSDLGGVTQGEGGCKPGSPPTGCILLPRPQLTRRPWGTKSISWAGGSRQKLTKKRRVGSETWDAQGRVLSLLGGLSTKSTEERRAKNQGLPSARCCVRGRGGIVIRQ